MRVKLLNSETVFKVSKIEIQDLLEINNTIQRIISIFVNEIRLIINCCFKVSIAIQLLKH